LWTIGRRLEVGGLRMESGNPRYWIGKCLTGHCISDLIVSMWVCCVLEAAEVDLGGYDVLSMVLGLGTLVSGSDDVP
jgi:hypothetical protein